MNHDKINEFIKQVQNFYDLSHSGRTLLFGYYLQFKENYDCFNPKDILSCYSHTSTPPPSNIFDVLFKLAKAKKIIIRKDCSIISGQEIQKIEEEILGVKPLISIKDELNELPSKMPDPIQSKYVEEILGCIQVKAWRAAIVMTWILTLDHLQRFILFNQLEKFNEILKENKNYVNFEVENIGDFEEIKDSDFLRVIRTCSIVTSSQLKILEKRLDERNSYAHPTDLELTDTITMAFIEDLIGNVILKIS